MKSRTELGVNTLVRLGVVIRSRREELGMSQEELASKAGLHRTYICDAERGRRNLSVITVMKLSMALGVSLQQIFSSVDEARQAAPSALALDQEENQLS